MCGITAIFSPHRDLRPEDLVRGTTRLHHRGPDGQRTWVSPDRRVGLGHARLSIIDLTTGQQPIANETGELQVVVNGELYDYERTRVELQKRGHRLSTRSDSEIVLHLYEELGTRCLHSLRGEFAFALWDGPGQTLFAARDRFGIKPLFYAWHAGALYLASEAKALFAAGVPARWDSESFYQCASLYLEGDRSMFEGVYQVPPGHFLLATPHHFQVLRYWDFDYPKASVDPGREEAHVERLRHELTEAVRLRLRADVPVGCYLSGGIDSCAILGLASQLHSEPIDAYTMCFEGDTSSEEALAHEMAKKAGARFHPLRLTGDQLADSFSDAVFHAEVLPANENGVAKFLLSRWVHEQGNRVVLTGDGADESLAGYANYRRDMLLYNRHGQDPAEVPALLAQLEQSNAVSRGGTLFPSGPTQDLSSVKSVMGFVPSWMEAFSAVGTRLQSTFSDDFLAARSKTDPFRLFLNRQDVEGQLAGREAVHQSMYLFAKTYLPNYMLCWLGDRMEMAHSVEGRVPFLDHRLVEAVVAMPVSMKIRGGIEKYVLREAARPFITPSVYSREKHPFTLPSSSLRPEGRLHQLVQDTLRGPALRSVPFFSPAKVVSLLDRLPTMDETERHAWGFPLTRVLGACLIHQRFGL